MKDFYKVYFLFLGDTKARFFFLLLCMLGMALLQTAGIASILPFIAVLSSPETIQTNPYLAGLYDGLAFKDLNSFLLFLGIGTLIVLIASNAFAAFTTRMLISFTFLQGHALSLKLFRKYLSHSYKFFLNRNSADLLKNIITEIDRSVIGVFSPALDIIARSVITLFILAFLVALDPLLAILTILVCGGSYALVYLMARRSLANSGKKAADSQSLRNKIVSEAFGGIKEIKLLGREEDFYGLFQPQSREFAMSLTNSKSFSELPKYALETIIFGGILLIMLYLIGIKQNISGVIPLLALYAFAGYRLMPALQRIFAGMAALRYYLPVLDTIYKDLTEDAPEASPPAAKTDGNAALSFNESLVLKDVSFNYPNSSEAVLRNINLSIESNTTVGFVGTTGSGKTTLVDIILGLLPLTGGKFIIDGVPIGPHSMRKWQRNIGYVPQEIYLADDTVTRNIAFGVPDDEINHQAVKRAAEIANIDGFVMQSLSHGYDTCLGERGVRLSGGQRQRIGIARALYNDPRILILDEATSALDGATEKAIMEEIHHLHLNKTIIMIAHRITTVQNCDIIYVMAGGQILESGTYDELMSTSNQFRELAKTPNRPFNQLH